MQSGRIGREVGQGVRSPSELWLPEAMSVAHGIVDAMSGGDALAGLDDVDWAGLRHAYGPAGDTPGLLRALVSESPAKREHAVHELYGNIFHQGSRYEATAHAVPFLAGLALIRGHRNGMRSCTCSRRWPSDTTRRTCRPGWISADGGPASSRCVRQIRHSGCWNSTPGSRPPGTRPTAGSAPCTRRLMIPPRRCVRPWTN
jgi:hypothetical protein